jgi:hypothetical protein
MYPDDVVGGGHLGKVWANQLHKLAPVVGRVVGTSTFPSQIEINYRIDNQAVVVLKYVAVLNLAG